MKKSKGIAFVWAILLVLLVGVVAAAGTYFGAKWYQNYKAKQEAKKLESQDKTATWNTYLNDQLYFTFKYPQGWTYEQTKWTDENWKKSRSFKLTFKPEDFAIEVNPWSASMAVLTHAFDGYEKTSSETVKIDGVSATKEIWDTNAKGKELYKEDYQSIVYKITHDADDITIYFNYKKASETERFENFKLLMSTFKWTKTTGNANTNSKSEIDSWKTYTNDKYSYSFKYPADYTVGNDCPKPCKGQVNTLEGGNHTFMSGDISEKGWPMISITHYDTEFYNHAEGQGLYEWLKEKAFGDTKENLPSGTTQITTGNGKLEVVKVEISKSPQAYSRWEIYFMKDDKIFMMQMLDVDTKAAQDFYNLWLTGFKK